MCKKQVIHVREANKRGYSDCYAPGIIEASYPSSKTRRGRVINGGKVSNAICTTGTLLLFVGYGKKKKT